MKHSEDVFLLYTLFIHRRKYNYGDDINEIQS